MRALLVQVKIILKVRQVERQGGSEFQAKGTACVNQRSDSKRKVMMGETGGSQKGWRRECEGNRGM